MNNTRKLSPAVHVAILALLLLIPQLALANQGLKALGFVFEFLGFALLALISLVMAIVNINRKSYTLLSINLILVLPFVVFGIKNIIGVAKPWGAILLCFAGLYLAITALGRPKENNMPSAPTEDTGENEQQTEM